MVPAPAAVVGGGRKPEPEIDRLSHILKIFNDQETYKLNQHIRILKCGALATLPKYVGDPVDGYRTMKVLADGSVVIADSLFQRILELLA